MNPHTIELRVFGALRKVSDDQGMLRLMLDPGQKIGSVGELKQAIKKCLAQTHPEFDGEILDECAIADEAQVLFDGALLQNLNGLAVLPPVCGG